MFLSIYNRSLVNTWGFVPMSADEMQHLAGGLRHIIVPEMAIAAEIDGRVVGASFGLPDYNPRIKEIDGRLFPFGFLHLLRNRRAIKRIRLISTNVLPEYQRMGVGLVLMHGLVPKAIEWGLEEAEFSWVLESNSLSYGALKKGGAKITKTYRLYDLGRAGGSGRVRGREVRGQAEAETQRQASARRSGSLSLASDVPSPPWKSAKSAAAATSTGSSSCRGGSTPRTRTGSPPLLMEVKEFLDRRKHPFYKHGDATQFIAVRGERDRGPNPGQRRPAATTEQHGENLGCFGMFECVDDRATAHALLDAAAGWLRGRGRTSIRGPIDYSINYPCGLLVEGFDTPPRIMMNHNRRYYAGPAGIVGPAERRRTFTPGGSSIRTTWCRSGSRGPSGWRGGAASPFAPSASTTSRPRWTAARRSTTPRWASCGGSSKLTEAEFQYFAKRLENWPSPNRCCWRRSRAGRSGSPSPCPTSTRRSARLNGRLTRFGLPLGLLRFLRRKRHIKTARMVVLDVLKEYRRRGIAELLILRTLDYGKNVLGYTGAELSWTLEDNDAVNRTIEAVGARRYKTYRMYEKDIAAKCTV